MSGRKNGLTRFIIAALVLFAAPGAARAAVDSGYEWFWVFYEKDAARPYSSIVYRPFYMRNAYSGGKTFRASLMPVVYWEYATARKTEWKSLLGFVHSVDYRHPDGRPDYDLGVFPLLYYGDSPDRRDRYFLMMPIGGTVKGKLGQDRISPWIFPGFLLFFLYPPATAWQALLCLAASFVPVYVDYQSRDYSAFGILWPLVQRGKSPDRDDFRILPLYAHNYKRNAYDNYSVLLIGNYQNVYMKDDNQKTLFVFPFYGRRWNTSDKAGASTLFWPFFSWGYNMKSGDYALNFPWPLVMIQDCADPYIYKRIYFPFYGRYVFRNSEMSFATPLHFRLTKKNESMRSDYTVNALIVWYFKRDYHHGPDPYYGNSWRYFKIWPLFQYERDDRGNMSFSALSLLPFRDPDGYELLYQPFWTLFEYRRFESGEKRFGVLLRTYYQAWSADFLDIRVPILFSFRSSKDELTKWSFLCSMFAYTRSGSRKKINVLWIPITIEKGDPAEERHAGRDEIEDVDRSGPVFPPPASPSARWALGEAWRTDCVRYSKAVF
ncbi:MAG TPA: hypothetical protein VLM75_00165 [Spirochaetota bacterium]|nr:hypothetical protein [Spirochaetota bacterium]